VEGLEEEVEAAAAAVAVVVVVVVPQGDLPDAHQAVPVVQARQVVHRADLGPEAPLLPVADQPVAHELARSSDPLDQMGYPLSLMVLVQLPVLAFWEDSAWAGSSDPSLAGTVGGGVATTGPPPVEVFLLTRLSLPWQTGRNREPGAVVSPSGSMFVGLAEE
jgi:hypothetical protein